ncbi:uncharacterized protein K02A2.6-like [Leguminivora glycinivorella]|uniref:uncharacterized protein K02A2.6-like n=1 Tax=Leguminivora glycinivorella TaxID=1035111 RepID=UPI00200DC5C7|nr:uncharacterized protein K02A2.6-like [Leguminivora glycinivorella]
MRARPLAYALRAPVERALDQLEREGIITPVETSDWATPIVPVVKRDGVVIDSTSKWLEVKQMTRTTAEEVIKVLREMFSHFGLPKMMVSDNGPPFTSAELANFMQLNGIKHTYSPAYHPSSNGAAEGAVKLVKRTILKALRDNQDVDTALQSYLLAYRNAIYSSTEESPARLLQRRGLRTRLDLLRADAGAAARDSFSSKSQASGDPEEQGACLFQESAREQLAHIASSVPPQVPTCFAASWNTVTPLLRDGELHVERKLQVVLGP